MVTPGQIQNVHLSEIIDSAMDAIISIDTNFRIIIYNHAAEQLFGYPCQEMIGQTLMRILPEEIRPIHDDILRKFIATPNSKIKLNAYGRIRGVRANGEIFPMEAAISKTQIDEEIILTAILRDISERIQSEGRINSLLQEKEHILKEIHHRVKNNLFTIFSLLEMQANEVSSSETKNSLLDAASRVRSMMTLYDRLYQKDNDLYSVNLREYLPTLATDIVGIFPSHIPVQIKTDIENVTLGIKVISPLGIIINEFITNSMKYAFKTDADRLITIHASVNQNHVTIVYEDNGVGMKEIEAQNMQRGFGLQMVHILVSQLNGSLKMESNPGTKFTIEFSIL
jgi:PAS domain S-box-containing protein